MRPEISERAFEEAIECALLKGCPDVCAAGAMAVRETLPPYDESTPSMRRSSRTPPARGTKVASEEGAGAHLEVLPVSVG